MEVNTVHHSANCGIFGCGTIDNFKFVYLFSKRIIFIDINYSKTRFRKSLATT